MARNSISSRQRYQIGQLLQTEWPKIHEEGQTKEQWAAHASSVLGFVVTVPNVRGATEMIGLAWKPPRVDAATALAERIRELEARVKRLEDGRAASVPPSLPFASAAV